jgi:hypothetical protein
MAWSEIVAGIFKPISDVIDHVLPSGDAKLQLQQKMIEAQMAASSQVMEYEKQLLDGQIKIITAEAQGQSWIQRNWRPITMLTFLALVVCDSFGWLPNRLAAQAWTLLQIGLGGYTIGRSAEKIVPAIVDAVKANK